MKLALFCTSLDQDIVLHDNARAIATFVSLQVPYVLGWSGFCQYIKHRGYPEVLFGLFTRQVGCCRQNCSLQFLYGGSHRRQIGPVVGLVGAECVCVVGIWTLASLVDSE